MAELTVLEEKLAEVLGLAMAAQGATNKVKGLTEDGGLSTTLDRMQDEAEQTEVRCTGLAEELDGRPIQQRHFKTALDGSLALAGQEDPNGPS
jgi:hypothetical protein